MLKFRTREHWKDLKSCIKWYHKLLGGIVSLIIAMKFQYMTFLSPDHFYMMF